MNLLIVESPAKAKTINKYLGKDYKVLASFGHVRDLPSKKGSVDPNNDFSLIYEVDGNSKKHLKAISDALKNSDKLMLATDPDREGEAISWHIVEALRQQKKLKKDFPIERVVFNEITKSAVKKAIENPREIDLDLVNAQQARRVLDYLVGFTLSPILWKKLPGSRSAGRVQSVALRIICEREEEIDRFRPQEYWDIVGDFLSDKKEDLTAKLVAVNGEKLEKLSIKDEKQAREFEAEIKEKKYNVESINSKLVKRRPYAPFTTSTMQQDAANKIGLSTKNTMQTAQKLYEGIDIDGETKGLITYMRTDGISISAEGINAIREHVKSNLGDKYIPEKPNFYKSKIKNAQEAHEAIRPTDVSLTPEKAKNYLSDVQYKLYKLIWERTVASQMTPQESLQTTIEIISDDKKYQFRVSGSVIKFKGFTEIYGSPKKDDDNILPALSENQDLDLTKIEAKQHFTEPPPRYNEASLVKKLEELGIGRPSTYASIISILIDREYARLDQKRFIPEDRGMIVTAFLVRFFEKYFEYNFTASLEEGLDEVSNGKVEWKNFLSNFWNGFEAICSKVGDADHNQIYEEITKALEQHYLQNEDGEIDRKCHVCDSGVMTLKTGKFGAFLACSNYPECKTTKQIGDSALPSDDKGEDSDSPLAQTPDGHNIFLKKGPYGHYFDVMDGENQVKRVGLPKFIKVSDLNPELAQKICTLPRNIGINPNNGKEVVANNGKFGPYLLNDGKFVSISNDDLFSIELNRALDLINSKETKKGGSGEIKNLGPHPKLKDEIKIMNGRYGPYIKLGKKNIALPKGTEAETLELDEAIKIIEKKVN